MTPSRVRTTRSAGPALWVRLVGAGVWLVFLNSTAIALWQQSGWTRSVGLVALALFCVVYLMQLVRGVAAMSGRPRTPLLIPWTGLGVLVVLAGLTVPGAQDESLSLVVFIGAAAVISLPLRHSAPLVGALFILGEATTRLVPGWHSHGESLGLLLAAFAVGFLRSTILRARKLRDAQQELADAAVAEERSRIAADLHDILGHSLTVITVKAELAQRLLDVDPERTRQELSDLQELSRSALNDVRSTALGMRGISLAGELATARRALDSAGLEGQLPSATDEVANRWRELFAWTVREAVTNVIRHSHATRCWIELSGSAVTISDDGIGMGGQTGGQGLSGLRHRAEAVGAHVSVTDRAGAAGVRVRLEIADDDRLGEP